MVKNLSFTKLIVKGLPVLLGVAMGFLIFRGELVYTIILALLIPAAIIFLKHPFTVVILWLLIYPLYFALPNPEMWHYVFHRLLIPFTLLTIIFLRISKPAKSPPLRLGLPELGLCILAVYIPISLLYSKVDLQTPLRLYVDRILVPFCMFFILRISTIDKLDIKLLQWAAFFIAVIQLFIGFLWRVAPQLVPFRPLFYSRLAGSLDNPNIFALALFFCICLLFQAAMEHKSRLVRIAFIIACGLSFIGAFLSMERIVWLAGITVILGLFILYPKVIMRYIIIISIIILFFGFGFLSSDISAATERIGEKGQIYYRVVATDAMIQMIKDKPIFGWGYNTLDSNIRTFYRSVGPASVGAEGFVTSHNSYLTIMTELGAFGLLLYIFPLLWYSIKTVRVWHKVLWTGIWNRKLLTALWLFLFSFIIIANAIDVRFFPYALCLWWMTLGMIVNLLNQQDGTHGVVVLKQVVRMRFRG